jgi:hypothetical protein
MEQAISEFGLGSVKDIKEFYINDVVIYFRETYRKVNKLYDEYKERKAQKQQQAAKCKDSDNKSDFLNTKNENDAIDEFMKDNDL